MKRRGFRKRPLFLCIKSPFYAYFCNMDHDIELRFQKLQKHLEKDFGPGMDMSTFLFLVGVNELGMGHQTFSKQQKMELMHIAICRLLEPYGYYEFEYFDNEGWPHYKVKEELPPLKAGEQSVLMKEAIVNYFLERELIQ